MRAFTVTVYVVLGTLALAAGIVALVAPGVIIPNAASSPLTAHLVREQAAGFVFIGLMFYWCLAHFEQRRIVHLALLLFTVLFAGIHFRDFLNTQRDILSPVINSIPVLLLALTAPFVRRP